MAKRNQNPKSDEVVVDLDRDTNPSGSEANADQIAQLTTELREAKKALADLESNPKKDRCENPKRGKSRRRKFGRKGRRGKPRRNPIATWAKTAMIAGGVLATGAIIYGVVRKTEAKKAVPKCGDKYAHLVVTSSGYTFDEPGSDLPFAGQSSYAEWYELANKLAQEARDRFAELGDIEQQANNGSYPKWNALVNLNNRMNARLDDLTSPSLVFLDYAGARSAAQTVIVDALCLMDKSDDGILAYGGSVPVTPTVTGEVEGVPAWKWFAIGGFATAALGGVAYALGHKPAASTPIRPSFTAVRARRPE